MGRGPNAAAWQKVIAWLILLAILLLLLTWLISPCAIWCIEIGYLIGVIVALILAIKYLLDRGPPMGDPRFRLRNAGTSKKPIKRVKAEAKKTSNVLAPVLDEVVNLPPNSYKTWDDWPPAEPTTEVCVTIEVDGKETEICHHDLDAPQGVDYGEVTLRMSEGKHIVTFGIEYTDVTGVFKTAFVKTDLVV